MALHRKIKQNVGIPVSIGIAPNKTLAKMASHYAKHYAGYHHCCAIDIDEKLRKQSTAAAVVGVFLATNYFRDDLQQYSNFGEVRLLTPSNASLDIVKRAMEALEKNTALDSNINAPA